MTHYAHTRDFHGWFTADALQEVDRIVGSVRMLGATRQYEFITGNGVIKHEILQLLKQYDLEGELKLGNAGVVVVTIS